MRPEPGWLEIGAMGAHLAFGTTCVAVGLAARTGHLRFLAWCTAATSAALAYSMLEYGKPGLGLTRLSGGLMVAFFLSISWDAGWLPRRRATVKPERETERLGMTGRVEGLEPGEEPLVLLEGGRLLCANPACGALIATMQQPAAGAKRLDTPLQLFRLERDQLAQTEGQLTRCLLCAGRPPAPARKPVPVPPRGLRPGQRRGQHPEPPKRG